MPINSLCIQRFRRRLNTLFIASSERLRGEGFSEKSHQIWVVTSGESVLLLAAILAISPYAKTVLVGLPITIASIKWVQNDSSIVSIVPIGRISEYTN